MTGARAAARIAPPPRVRRARPPSAVALAAAAVAALSSGAARASVLRALLRHARRPESAQARRASASVRGWRNALALAFAIVLLERPALTLLGATCACGLALSALGETLRALASQ